jgi:hypothetical protein
MPRGTDAGKAAGDANSEVYFEDLIPKVTIEKLKGKYPAFFIGLGQLTMLRSCSHGP